MAIPVSPFTRKIHTGIAIHTNAVRGVAVDAAGNLNRFGEFIFGKPILDTDVVDPKMLVQALKQLRSQINSSSSYVAVCFPEKYAFSREYRLPKLNRSEISEAVNWQVDKIFPFAKEDIYIDWKLLSINQDNTHILVTAVPKSILDHLRICLEQAGLFPISFEPSASGISHTLSPSEAKEAVILELETTSACVTLVYNGTSVSTATFNITPQSDMNQLISSIGQATETMVKKYLLKGSTAANTVTIYLTGEKAAPGLLSVLQPQLKYPLKLLTVNNVAPAYHLSYIAAKSRVLPPENDQTINLLPTELQRQYAAQLQHEQAQKGLITSIAFSLPALAFGILSLSIAYLSLGSVNKNIANLKTLSDAPIIAGLNLAKINSTAQRYNNLFILKTSPESVIQGILATIPPEINVSSLTFSQKTKLYTLTGSSKTRADLITYKQNMESKPEVKEFSLPLSALETTENVAFTISFKWEAKP